MFAGLFCHRLAGCLGVPLSFNMVTISSEAYQIVYHGKHLVFTMVFNLVATLVSFLSVYSPCFKYETKRKPLTPVHWCDRLSFGFIVSNRQITLLAE